MSSLTPGKRFETISAALFAGVLLIFIFFYATTPLRDPDFWWHLKSGEMMVKNQGLLQFDPFTFSGDGVVSFREALLLKGYWLWQLTAYGLYAFAGFNGIFLLNFLTVLAMAGVVARQMRRDQLSLPLAALLITIGFFLLSASFPLERPQVASFLLAAILLVGLDRVREGGELGWTLPLVMVVWANLHGGFVVGDLILCCFGVGAIVEYRQDLLRLRRLLLWVGAALGASLLNPTGALVFGELFSFHNSPLMAGVGEYQSTLVRFQNGSSSFALLWLLIALYALGIALSRRLYWPETIVALFLAVFSCLYARNVGFFAVAMLPAIGRHWQEGARSRQWPLPLFLWPLLPLCLTFLLWCSYALEQGRQGGWPVKAIYPEKAVAFLQESQLQGRMFNSYEYGGYLVWRLAPKIKIFIDGRALDPEIFADWQKISSASTAWVAGRREYERLLDRYAIDYVIQPIYDNDGMIQPLMKGLLGKEDWTPIYLDTSVYILARLTPKNAATISAYRIDKNEFKTRLLLTINYIAQADPRQIGYQVARAGMLIYLSMDEEARSQIEAIAAMAPQERSLPGLQRELAVLRAQRLRE